MPSCARATRVATLLAACGLLSACAGRRHPAAPHFVTKTGYGSKVLQRNAETINTLGAAARPGG